MKRFDKGINNSKFRKESTVVNAFILLENPHYAINLLFSYTL